MKHIRQNRISVVDYRHLCLLAVLAAVVLAGMRALLTPVAIEQPTAYCIGMVMTGVVLLALLALCAVKRTKLFAVRGGMSGLMSVGTAVTGATLLVFSINTAMTWQANGMPFPAKSVPTNVDLLFLYLLIIMGALAGVYFLTVATCWLFSGYTRRGILPLLSLAPIVWTWVRVVRYITSYASLVGLYHDLYDLATILFEMVFLVLFARYVAGEGGRDSRFFVGVSLCCGVVCSISGITQAVLYLQQDLVSFETCQMVIAPDFGLALLAFSCAFSQAFGRVVKEEEILPEITAPEPQPEPTTQEEEIDPEDGEGAEFLLSDEWFAVFDPEEPVEDPD